MLVALTAKEAGGRCAYPARRVRELWRLGRFPAPIDPHLPTISLRWSEASIDAYVSGEWVAPAPLVSVGKSGPLSYLDQLLVDDEVAS